MKRIESIKNPQVKQWKKLHTKKDRDKTGTFLIEGFHLVEEALTHKELMLELIVSENVDLPNSWNIDHVNLTIVTDEIINAISQTETSQGIVALCKQLPNSLTSDFKGKRLLLLDAVQDPGNVGTMIRTAEAAGIDAVVVGEGSVDIYNSKVIRSTQGAIFHLPIIQANLLELVEQLKEAHVPIFGTSLQNAVNYKEVPPQNAFAIIVGNEGNGVNQQLLDKTTRNLYIPIYGKSESLNVAVAAAILLYHLR